MNAQLQVLGAIGAIASSPSPVRDRIEETVHTLGELVPYVAYHVGYRASGAMTTIVSDGYDTNTRKRFESRGWLGEADSIVVAKPRANSHALRQCDLDDPSANETVSKYLRPAGFHAGVSCLIRGDAGKYVTGVVNLSAGSPGAVSEPAREVLDLAGSSIGNLLNEYRLGAGTHATYILDVDGRLRFSAGPEEFHDSEIENQIVDRLHGVQPPYPSRFRLSVNGEDVLLGIAPVSYFGGRRARALVTAHRAEPLGLTDREVDVVQLIARGCKNPEIAERLLVSRRTVATHVEHILTRLGLANRTEVAVWAWKHGVSTGPAS